jgi:signal transduction histidine kinase
MSKTKSITIVLPDENHAMSLSDEVLVPAGYQTSHYAALEEAASAFKSENPQLLLLDSSISGAVDWAADLLGTYPACGLVMLKEEITSNDLQYAMQIGICAVLPNSHSNAELIEAFAQAEEHNRRMHKWLKSETGQLTGSLSKRLNELESILKQVSDGVIVLDGEQHIVILNRAMRDTFKLGQGELKGQAVHELIDDRQLLELLGAGEERLLRGEIEAPDGKTYGVNVSQVVDVGTIASLHDISDLKELDRLKGDFVNTVSHDLRSPLTAILGYVELIERTGEVNEQQATFIQRVKESVSSTTRLINDLLNLGRVEVGDDSEMERLDLRSLVGERVEGHRAMAEEQGIKLRTQFEKRVPLVAGNETQLRQVADNLIGNAIKYTQNEGEVRVMLREQGDQVVLYVGDNGPGIPAEEHGRIFEKFYRSKDAPEDVEGTGLGLAIVKGIVDNHRGRIWVDSSPGKGSIFAVVLPIAD